MKICSLYELFQAYYKKQSDENTINFYNGFIKRFRNYKYLKNIQEFRELNLYEDEDRESFLKEFFFSIVIDNIEVINIKVNDDRVMIGYLSNMISHYISRAERNESYSYYVLNKIKSILKKYEKKNKKEKHTWRTIYIYSCDEDVKKPSNINIVKNRRLSKINLEKYIKYLFQQNKGELSAKMVFQELKQKGIKLSSTTYTFADLTDEDNADEEYDIYEDKKTQSTNSNYKINNALMELKNTLLPEEMNIFIMYLEGKKFEYIANKTKISIGSVHNRMKSIETKMTYIRKEHNLDEEMYKKLINRFEIENL